MKNIYIIGVPRSGKTTLSKLIKNKFPIYNHIIFEAVRNGFIETQPQLDMDERTSEARKNILPRHIVTMAYWNNKISSNPTLIEGSFCSVKELSELVSFDDVIICLGLGCRSLDEIISKIIENDSDDDYTKDWSFERLKKHFYNIEEEDKNNFNFCMNNNIKYYDMFLDREKTFSEILDYIGDL